MIGLNSDDRVHIILTTPNPWGLPKRGHIKRVTDLRSGYSFDAKKHPVKKVTEAIHDFTTRGYVFMGYKQ